MSDEQRVRAAVARFNAIAQAIETCESAAEQLVRLGARLEVPHLVGELRDVAADLVRAFPEVADVAPAAALRAALREAHADRRQLAAALVDLYPSSGCDCDPSVGVTGCAICRARTIVDAEADA